MRLAEPAIADALFSLGYDGPTSRLYEGWQSTDPSVPLDTADTMTLEDAAGFLDSEYGVRVSVSEDGDRFYFSIFDRDEAITVRVDGRRFRSYDKALELGLVDAIVTTLNKLP